MDIFHVPAIHVSKDLDDIGIPIAYSKCNETFQTGWTFTVHSNEAHVG